MNNPLSAIIEKIKSKDKVYGYIVLDDKDRIISIANSFKIMEEDFHKFNRYKNLFGVRIYKLFDLELIKKIREYLNDLSF